MGGTLIRCALIGAITLALSNCGSADPPAQPLPPPVQAGGDGAGSGPSSSTSAGAQVDRTDPVAAYTGWWMALEKALATANSKEPSLAIYGANPLLQATRFRILTLAALDVVQVVHFGHQQQIVAQTPTRVDIADCVTTPANSYRDSKTGQPRAPQNIRNDITAHDSIRSVLQLVDGAWHVTAIQAGGKPC